MPVSKGNCAVSSKLARSLLIAANQRLMYGAVRLPPSCSDVKAVRQALRVKIPKYCAVPGSEYGRIAVFFVALDY